MNQAPQPSVGERIRVAVVGAGMRGCWGVGAIGGCPDFALAAVVDPVRERADLVAAQLAGSDVPKFSDLKQCLESAKVDAVAIFTPDGTHADLACPALCAGKWVLVEKPLDISEARIQEMIEADAAAGGKTFVSLNLRYAALYQKVHELIERGVAGKLLTIQADEFYDGGRTYFRRWNRLRKFGGGLWITKACHDFDLLYWMAKSRPVSVHASCSLDYYKPKAEAAMYCRDCRLAADCPDEYNRRLPDSLAKQLNQLTERATGVKPDLCLYNSDKDTFDHGAATVTFENGIIATYTLNVVAGITNRRIRVAGTRAMIDGDLEQSSVTIHQRDPARREVVELDSGGSSHGGGDEHVFPSFARFIRGQPARFVSPAEAAVSVRIGLAATQSCDRQTVVRLS